MLELFVIGLVLLLAYKFGTVKEIYVKFGKDNNEKKPPNKRLKK
jgi:hypothetical protein